MIRVAIIEDNKKYLECLASNLAKFPDIEVVHQLSNAMRLKTAFWQTLPDVSLIDINLPGIGGMEALNEIRQDFPSVKCMMLTVYAELDLLMKAMRHGAMGYLIKDRDNILKIVESLRILHNQSGHTEFPLNGGLAKQVLDLQLSKEKSVDEKMDGFGLTSRQREIVKLMMGGKTYRQIAEACHITVDTLNSHIKIIYPKLRVKSRGELSNIF